MTRLTLLPAEHKIALAPMLDEFDKLQEGIARAAVTVTCPLHGADFDVLQTYPRESDIRPASSAGLKRLTSEEYWSCASRLGTRSKSPDILGNAWIDQRFRKSADTLIQVDDANSAPSDSDDRAPEARNLLQWRS